MIFLWLFRLKAEVRIRETALALGNLNDDCSVRTKFCLLFNFLGMNYLFRHYCNRKFRSFPHWIRRKKRRSPRFPQHSNFEPHFSSAGYLRRPTPDILGVAGLSPELLALCYRVLRLRWSPSVRAALPPSSIFSRWPRNNNIHVTCRSDTSNIHRITEMISDVFHFKKNVSSKYFWWWVKRKALTLK